MEKQLEQYYDDYWGAGGYAPRDFAAGPTLERLAATYMASAQLVIEVGCGDAQKNGRLVKSIGAQYRGFDISPTAVDIARGSGFHAELVAGAEKLPLASESVDAVMCTEVLEHLVDPAAAVREAQRVLKRGGVYLCTVPNVANWRQRTDLALLGRWNPGGDDQSVARPWRDPHIRFFTLRSLRDLMRAEGLTHIESGGTVDVHWAMRLPGLRRHLKKRPPRGINRVVMKLIPTLLCGQLYLVARKSC